ncbi:hypothetical protein L1F34_002360 [Mammaliicoccus lentus]
MRQSLQSARFDFADFLVNKIEDKRNIKEMALFNLIFSPK